MARSPQWWARVYARNQKRSALELFIPWHIKRDWGWVRARVCLGPFDGNYIPGITVGVNARVRLFTVIVFFIMLQNIIHYDNTFLFLGLYCV